MRHGNFERVGERQYVVILRARRSVGGFVMPGGFLERRACNRLARRDPALLVPTVSFPDVWALTVRGKNCALVVQ